MRKIISFGILIITAFFVENSFALSFTTSNSTFDNAPNGYSWAGPYNRKIQTNLDPATGTMVGSVYRKIASTGTGTIGGTTGAWGTAFFGSSAVLYDESIYQGGTGDQVGNPGGRNMYACEFIHGYYFALFSDLDTSSSYEFSQPMFVVCDATNGWDDAVWSAPKRIEAVNGTINTSAWYGCGDVAYNPEDGYYYWTTSWKKTYNNGYGNSFFMIVGRTNTPADPESWEWTDYNELYFDPANPDTEFSSVGYIKPAYAKDIYGNGNGFGIAVINYTDKNFILNDSDGNPVDVTYRPRLGYIYTTNWGADWSTGEFKANWNTLRNEGNNFMPANINEMFDWYNTLAPNDSIGTDINGNTVYSEYPLNFPFFPSQIDVTCTENNFVHVIAKVEASTTEYDNLIRFDTNYEKVVKAYYDIIGEITETGVVWQNISFIGNNMGIDDFHYEWYMGAGSVGYAGNGVIYATWWDRPEIRWQDNPYIHQQYLYIDDAFFSYSADNGKTWSFDKTVTFPNEYVPGEEYELRYVHNLTKTAGLHEGGWSVSTHGTNVAPGTNDGVLTVYAACQYYDETNPVLDPPESFEDYQQFLKVWKITGTGTGIETEQVSMIKDFTLEQNYPNPFNPSTEIRFALQNDSKVKLSVYNTKGELVANLKNEKMLKGSHSVNFDASAFNSGVYFYKLEVNGFSETKKMVLTR
ncbi:TPA: hypothetical protein DCR49_09750 [Candidatus Delongbacteria bacterium]|nr:hypothetical protein [Candidatus Delongbacteria bacterium]